MSPKKDKQKEEKEAKFWRSLEVELQREQRPTKQGKARACKAPYSHMKHFPVKYGALHALVCPCLVGRRCDGCCCARSRCNSSDNFAQNFSSLSFSISALSRFFGAIALEGK